MADIDFSKINFFHLIQLDCLAKRNARIQVNASLGELHAGATILGILEKKSSIKFTGLPDEECIATLKSIISKVASVASACTLRNWIQCSKLTADKKNELIFLLYVGSYGRQMLLLDIRQISMKIIMPGEKPNDLKAKLNKIKILADKYKMQHSALFEIVGRSVDLHIQLIDRYVRMSEKFMELDAVEKVHALQNIEKLCFKKMGADPFWLQQIDLLAVRAFIRLKAPFKPADQASAIVSDHPSVASGVVKQNIFLERQRCHVNSGKPGVGENLQPRVIAAC